MKKTDIRKEYLIKRRNLSDKFVQEKSIIIQNKIYASDWYKKAKSIMIYISFENEVETHSIINNALENGKKVIVSVCSEGNILIPVQITSLNDMKPNKYGISEPKTAERYIGDINAVLVPGIAFDRNFSRVGFGCGYYDRFLCNHIHSLKVGLCFNEQICGKIDADTYDIPMDIIITDEEILIRNV